MQAKPVPDNIIVVKVSRRMYRVGILRNAGKGYSHFNHQPWGLTNIREYEFLDGTFNHLDLHNILAEYAATEQVQEFKE